MHAEFTPRSRDDAHLVRVLDGFIWFNGTSARQWLTRMESSGRATFFLLDRENNWKWAQVWGRVVQTADDQDAAQFKRLGKRYGREIGAARDRR